jgi:hypothetical protein
MSKKIFEYIKKIHTFLTIAIFFMQLLNIQHYYYITLLELLKQLQEFTDLVLLLYSEFNSEEKFEEYIFNSLDNGFNKDNKYFLST